jgi:propionate CoA-transferase
MDYKSPRIIISRRVLQEFKPGNVINFGAGIGMYDVSRVAMLTGVSKNLFFTIEQGPLGGLPSAGGVAINPEAFLDSLEVFDFYDGGGIDVAVLSFAEVDKDGDVNVSKFNNTIPGTGGFINISQHTRKVIFCGTLTTKGLAEEVLGGGLKITQEGKIKRFVKQVEHLTFSGKHCDLNKQEILYITERCVFKLVQGGLMLIEAAAGVDIQRDILSQIEFEVKVAEDLKKTDAEIYKEFQRAQTDKKH